MKKGAFRCSRPKQAAEARFERARSQLEMTIESLEAEDGVFFCEGGRSTLEVE